MLPPHLLNVVVELLLRDLQRLTQILEDLNVVVLLRPVGRVEPIVVSDGWLDPCGHQELSYISTTLFGGDVQRGEPRLVLDGGVPAEVH